MPTRGRLWPVLLLALVPVPAPADAAPPTVIRVGGPSAPSDSKVAVVAGGRRLTGTHFTVVNAAGRTVLRGTLKAARGTPKPWRFAATADLSKLRTPGRYRVRALGRTSGVWRVEAAPTVALSRRLLRLFDVNADGAEPNPVFGASHLNDAIAPDGRRVDLVGGWRDAGDNLKFANTTAYAVVALELTALLRPELAAEVRQRSDVGVRWLRKAHPAPDEFYGLVGDRRDHETGFRDPATDDRDERDGVGVRHAYPAISADVLAKPAAALALAAARTAVGPERDALLAAAQEWYARALAVGKLVRTESPFVEDFYPDDGPADDLALAAVALHHATGDPALAAAAAEHLRAGGENVFYSGTTSGSVGPLAASLLCGGLGLPAVADAAAREVGCDGVRQAVSAGRERLRATAFGTPGIITFGWIQDHAAAGSVAAAAARSGVAADGRTLATAARDYLLGRNPYGRRFVVGPGAGEVRNPHHSAYLKGSAARLLDGAVVGGIATRATVREQQLQLAAGPDRRFDSDAVVYDDRRDNYVTNEVALTYQASALLLAASL